MEKIFVGFKPTVLLADPLGSLFANWQMYSPRSVLIRFKNSNEISDNLHCDQRTKQMMKDYLARYLNSATYLQPYEKKLVVLKTIFNFFSFPHSQNIYLNFS